MLAMGRPIGTLDASAARSPDRVAGGEGRALRRAVAVDQRAAGNRLERAPDARRGESIASGQELAQRREILNRSSTARWKRPAVSQRVVTPCRRMASARSSSPGVRAEQHDEAAAVQERAPDLERGRVEGGRRGLQEHLVRAEARVVRAADEADDAAMHDGDALRLSGRARRVEDVGEVERRSGSGRVQLALPSDRIRIRVEADEGDPGGGQGVGERLPADQRPTARHPRAERTLASGEGRDRSGT